tara:strand:+ start:464 stop:634 length:171 start_codon:yes stop_codon:yes gene_type:complete
MEEDYNYGGWLTEDLKELHKDLLKERSRCEIYSDRVELNKIIKKILSELQSRERNS